MKIKGLYISMAFAAMTVCPLSSCVNNWIDQLPADGVDVDAAVSTVSSLTSVRAGLYAAVKGNSSLVDYYGRNIFFYGDIRGEDVQYNWVDGSGRGSFYYYMTYTTADNFSNTYSVWQSPFIVMARANRIIQAVDNGMITDAEGSEATLQQYKAEAKVLRAMALFDLTRMYGRPYTEDGGASLGAPIMYDVVEDPGANKPARSTVAECYDSIRTDLTTAINSGALATGVTPGYINQWAAEALLVRVYLTMGNWTDALATARDIIENSPYTLWTTGEYANAWYESDGAHNDEIMFELTIIDTTDNTDREGVAYCYADKYGTPAGYGDVMVTKSFSDMLASDPEDVRNDVLLKPGGDPSNYTRFGDDFCDHGVFINKMPGGTTANVPVLRLSEVYLSAAEAAYNLGDASTAAQYLNDIITNRTTDPTKTVTAADITLDRIYIERRKELVGEGQRYFDVMRRGETVTRYTDASDRGWHDVLNEDARTFNRDSKKALPLIPTSEIDANPNMQQNPAY